jgi:hypothetical protein
MQLTELRFTEVAMQINAVFAKTDKGRDEIRTRAAGLAQPLRILLIATDGEKDVAKLARLHPAGSGVVQLIEQLAALGLIESKTASASRAPEPRFARSAASVAAVPEMKYVMSLR